MHAVLHSAKGRIRIANAETNNVQVLDPISLNIQANDGMIKYFSRQYDRALEQERKVLDADPSFVQARRKLAYALEAQGSEQEALAEWLTVEQQQGANEKTLAAFKQASATSGLRGYWLQAAEIERKQP